MTIYRRFCEEQFDEQGKPVSFKLKYPDNFNFGYDVVDQIAEDTPQKRALVWCGADGQERIFTFKEMKDLSNQAAAVLTAHGIGKGDRVLVMLKRHYEYWFTAVALHKLGAVLVPVTNMLTAEDLVYRISNGGIKGVICTPQDDAPQKVLSAKERCDSLQLLWTVKADVPGFMNLSVQMEAADVNLLRCDTRVTDPLVIYYTSGTTGYPKGVVHDHSYPLSHIITARYWQRVVDGGLHFTVAETGWAKTSWGKIYGQWLAGSAVMAYDFDTFDPKQLMSVINRFQVTTFCAPPTVYRYFVKKGLELMPSLTHVSTAGEALNPEVFRRFEEKTGLSLAEGYGQTESALILGNFPWNEYRSGSMGKPSPLYHVELMKDDGSFAEAGEIGEIVLVPSDNESQPGIFKGYHENSALYENAWRGGVYHTGDTAWKDSDGYFWFNGRSDDIIKSCGFRVGPFEIENVLMEHPAVLECSVIGIPDKLRGQAIKAIVVPTPGTNADAALQKELRDFCNARVAEYKWIRSVEFVTAMPKTISGKIRKTDLRASCSGE